MYYTLLLDWKKCHLYAFDCLIKNFLWNKAHNRGLVLSAWDFICQPKSKGGLGILHLQSHMMARRVAFIIRITSASKPLWTDGFWKILDNATVYYKGAWKMNAWNKFSSHAPLQTSSTTLSMLLTNFKKTASLLKWNGPWVEQQGNSIIKELILSHTAMILNGNSCPFLPSGGFMQDWLLAKHTRWWNGTTRTYYLSLADRTDITP
ncbi:hypothetical protein KP509_11G020400 [Ceratopteris richardii]|uniref:Uncharacterized protein n=1 Tax=Ceratopteris richardii TaxID=49495 RepID=A0A8T2TTG6_CERRI|nr:hypothetical protein KP509_11G020400 [Ceratopteris richardii]